MTGFEIKPEVLKNLEEFLTLDSKEIKVYLGLISLGNISTLGQISLVTGVDILVANATLESLTHKGYVSHFQGNISRYIALEPFLESYSKLFDPMNFAGIIRKISKSLETSPLSLIEDSEMFKNYIDKSLTEKRFELLKDKILDPDVKELLESYTKIAADTAFEIIQNMEDKGKKIQAKASKSFQQETNAIFLSISEARKSLTSLFEISREIKTPATFSHDVLVGESSILICLRDIITRARKSVLIFLPQPEIKSLMNLIDLSQSYDIKIEVIGDIEKTPEVILNKVRDEGIGINLRQLDLEFWGVLMDDKEFLFAPNPSSEGQGEITGILTTFQPLIESFAENLKKLILRAKPI